MKKYDAVLFDLDGTLSASAEGVRKCIGLTLDEMGKPRPDLSDYSKYIGPPLTWTFRHLCGLNDEESMRALPVYRRYYDICGTKENYLYDGLKEVLEALRGEVKLAVCTSKNERLAKDVIDLLGVREYFDAVCGSLDNGSRKEKPELIPYTLAELGGIAPERAVMIGDTFFDAKGARAVGVDFIGVLYGYGTKDSMARYGAVNFAKSPQELLPYIL